jgi:hypothetical protein
MAGLPSSPYPNQLSNSATEYAYSNQILIFRGHTQCTLTPPHGRRALFFRQGFVVHGRRRSDRHSVAVVHRSDLFPFRFGAGASGRDWPRGALWNPLISSRCPAATRWAPSLSAATSCIMIRPGVCVFVRVGAILLLYTPFTIFCCPTGSYGEVGPGVTAFRRCMLMHPVGFHAVSKIGPHRW